MPKALQDAGLNVRTLADVYGEAEAQATPDVMWIDRAAAEGWVVLCKDDHIRRRPAEREALTRGQVRAFCLMNASLSFADQAACFVTNKYRILQACAKPGPYVYGVYKDTIRKVWPPDNAVGQGADELKAERAGPDAGQVPAARKATRPADQRQPRSARPDTRASRQRGPRGPGGFGRNSG